MAVTRNWTEGPWLELPVIWQLSYVLQANTMQPSRSSLYTAQVVLSALVVRTLAVCPTGELELQINPLSDRHWQSQSTWAYINPLQVIMVYLPAAQNMWCQICYGSFLSAKNHFECFILLGIYCISIVYSVLLNAKDEALIWGHLFKKHFLKHIGQ